jgi:3-hydroxyacyl-CoA dehydrogenase
MTPNKPVRRIAIIGAGVIGTSWTAQYLARGLDVIATDPAPNAEAKRAPSIEQFRFMTQSEGRRSVYTRKLPAMS